MEIEVIHGQIVGKSNNYQVIPDKAAGGRRIIKTEKLRAYERSFDAQCKIYRNRLISCRFKFVAVIYQSNMRFDIDNSVKTVLDCLQYARAITDDSFCVKLDIEKRIDPQRPRIEFGIEPINEQKSLF